MGYDKGLCDMIKTHMWQDIRAFDIQHGFNKNVLLCLELKDMFQLNTSESKTNFRQINQVRLNCIPSVLHDLFHNNKCPSLLHGKKC